MHNPLPKFVWELSKICTMVEFPDDDSEPASQLLGAYFPVFVAFNAPFALAWLSSLSRLVGVVFLVPLALSIAVVFGLAAGLLVLMHGAVQSNDCMVVCTVPTRRG